MKLRGKLLKREKAVTAVDHHLDGASGGLTAQHLAFDILDVLLPFAACTVVPEFGLEYFVCHALGFFGRVILAYSGEYKKTLADSRDELVIYGYGSRLDALYDGWQHTSQYSCILLPREWAFLLFMIAIR